VLINLKGCSIAVSWPRLLVCHSANHWVAGLKPGF
jgi:hypothetical protein